MTDFATTVYGGAGGDLMTGTEENNLIFANQGNDTVNSGAGDDFVYGWTGDDVIRGEAGNDTLSGEDGNDVLVGGSGGDQFFGGIGDDTIIGGLGYDIMNAGEGADVFRFETLADSSTSQRDFIVNYEAGVDKIDLSGLGFDAISTSAGAPQGTLVASFEASLNRTHITDEYSDFSFSIDGNYANTLSNTDFIFESDTTDGGDGVDFIYTPILGQSNANSLHYLQGDNESGASVLSEQLSSLSGVNVVSQTYNASGGLIYLGMGGSSVDGNLATVEADRIWWYPDSNEAGAALIRAVAFMKRQLEDLVDEGVVKTALTWWQGENSGWEVGFNADPANAAERYRQATSDIFDYIQAELGLIEGVGDIDFYLIQTPFFDVDAATNGGLSQANQTTLAQGLTLVREQQELLADLRDDVHYAVTIDDLPTAEDSGDPESATDQWHLDDNSYEVIGARLASFIADDLGYTTDAAQLLQGTQEAELLVGGVGDDTLIGDDGNDSLEGAEGEDEIFGGKHDDLILAGAGDDRVNAQWGNDTVYGGAGDDLVNGYSGDDEVHGNDGNDRVYGASGNDTLFGEDGNDILSGYNGDDILNGGAGRDVLVGGNGADIFVFSNVTDSFYDASTGENSQDRIAGFEVGLDMISLQGLGFTGFDTDGGYTEANELRIGYSEAAVRTYIVSDQSDFQFYLNGDYRLTLNDESFEF